MSGRFVRPARRERRTHHAPMAHTVAAPALPTASAVRRSDPDEPGGGGRVISKPLSIVSNVDSYKLRNAESRVRTIVQYRPSHPQRLDCHGCRRCTGVAREVNLSGIPPTSASVSWPGD